MNDEKYKNQLLNSKTRFALFLAFGRIDIRQSSKAISSSFNISTKLVLPFSKHGVIRANRVSLLRNLLPLLK